MMLHLDYAKKMEESGIIEELFMHEGAHVSLDGDHKKVFCRNLSLYIIRNIKSNLS